MKIKKITNLIVLCLGVLIISTISGEAEEEMPTEKKPVVSQQAKSIDADEVGENKNWVAQCSESVKMDLIYIEPCTFTMGSPSGELGRWTDESQHTVTLTHGYWLGKYEVTQAQYEAVMGENPSKFKGANHPVECVKWYQATEFCKKLTERERAAGRLPEGYEYTLPTEAQWEYACRAGTVTALNSGKNLTQEHYDCPNLSEVGWYISNSEGSTHTVGQKQPNVWGFYDMHGNVWEWCKDSCGYSNLVATDTYVNGVQDPLSTTGSRRVVRGGGWGCRAFNCRSAFRVPGGPGGYGVSLGFRACLARVR